MLMKRTLLLLAAVATAVFTACKYDDSEVLQKIGDLDDRLTTIEQQVSMMNQQIETLQQLMNGKKFISEVKQNADGSHTSS